MEVHGRDLNAARIDWFETRPLKDCVVLFKGRAPALIREAPKQAGFRVMMGELRSHGMVNIKL